MLSDLCTTTAVDDASLYAFSSSDDFMQSKSPSRKSQTPISKDTIMDIPVLKVLNVINPIAATLNVSHVIWDLNFQWTADPLLFMTLPKTFQPTPAQQTIPHHPFFDVLPWPSLREKLICVFSMPEQMRPPSARGPMALAQMSMDIDDFSEGWRVEGGTGMSEEDWEIGQAFFRHWWWALDRSIIENTNRLRKKRGAGRLMLEDVK